MSKLILSLILLFNLLSLNIINAQINNSIEIDTNSTIYDLIFFSKRVNTLQDSIQILTKKISSLQSRINKSTYISKTLNQKNKLYKKIYIEALKFYYLFKLNYTNPIIFIFSENIASKMYENLIFYKILINFIKTVHSYLNLFDTELSNNQKILTNYKKALTILISKNNKNKIQIDSLVNLISKQTQFLQQNNYKIRSYINKEYSNFEIIAKTIKTNMTFDTTKIQIQLTYPLNNATIVSSFGIHDHPTLKNVKIANNGIDIFSSSDSIVKSSTDGIVNSIIKLPTKTIAILIKTGSYFIVYSYLKNPLVKLNDTVYIGQPIAFVDNNYTKYNYPVINLQLWLNTKKLNPKKFLIKQ